MNTGELQLEIKEILPPGATGQEIVRPGTVEQDNTRTSEVKKIDLNKARALLKKLRNAEKSPVIFEQEDNRRIEDNVYFSHVRTIQIMCRRVLFGRRIQKSVPKGPSVRQNGKSCRNKI